MATKHWLVGLCGALMMVAPVLAEVTAADCWDDGDGAVTMGDWSWYWVGDPEYTAGPNETDIDGEERVIDGNDDGTARVDMGADEYYWSRADFNLDNFVNFIDYAIFAAAWQTSQGDPNYNLLCNLAADNNTIDYNDLRACRCKGRCGIGYCCCFAHPTFLV